MKVGIRQPYFFPYIGYFQLIAAVDVFVLYDNVEYTKKGWINRNRMLRDGKDAMFSLPLKKASDFLSISQRELSTEFRRRKLLNQFAEAYKKAPYFANVYPLLEQAVAFEDANLFRYVRHSLIVLCSYLGIDTEIKTASDINIDHKLKSQDKVLAMCGALKAHTYVNAIGGLELYGSEDFQAKNLALKFIRAKLCSYLQLGFPYVPGLSIIDVLMFNSADNVKEMLTDFEWIEGRKSNV